MKKCLESLEMGLSNEEIKNRGNIFVCQMCNEGYGFECNLSIPLLPINKLAGGSIPIHEQMFESAESSKVELQTTLLT